MNSGATVAATLLLEGPDAWLTNEWVGIGLARWWDLTPSGAVMRPRTMAVTPGLHFPYGLGVEDP